MARGRGEHGEPIQPRKISDQLQEAGLLPTPGLKGHDTKEAKPKRVTKKFLRTHGKRCFQCAQVKPLMQFSRDTTKPYNCGSRCRECDVARVLKRHANRSRITSDDRAQALKDNADPGYCCYICGQEMCQDQRIDLDHVIPLSVMGGKADAIWNLAPVHQQCNEMKWRHHWSKPELERAIEAGDEVKADWLEELYDRMHRKSEELDLRYNLITRVHELHERLNALQTETSTIFTLEEEPYESEEGLRIPSVEEWDSFDPLEGVRWDDPEEIDDF